MCIMCDVDDPSISRRRRRFLRRAIKTCKRFVREFAGEEFNGWEVSMAVSEETNSADIWVRPPGAKPMLFSFGWVTEVWADVPAPTRAEVAEIAEGMRRRHRKWMKRVEREREAAGAVH